MSNEIREFTYLWIGKELKNLTCACELLSFEFSGDLVLHVIKGQIKRKYQ